MYEVEKEAQKKVRCLLVFPPSVHQRELNNLVESLDMEVADTITLPARNQSASIARFGIGSGKAQEGNCRHPERQLYQLQASPVKQETTVLQPVQREW